MDPTYITPFIGSITNVFDTMLQLPITIGEPQIKTNRAPSHDISGIIGMSGDVDGTVVLSFPTATAERAVTPFTGMPIDAEHEDFADAIGELVNMVSGGAKAQFQGKTVGITTPSVIIGKDHVVFGQKDMITVTIPCSCDVGEFNVEVAIRKNTAQAASAESESAQAGT